MDRRQNNLWWGPPRNFVPEIDSRKISWLELFYDLVYVIAIARITHVFAAHPGPGALLDYAYLFIMIYWGWLNGSMYHDLHGSPGIRTRFMTLWQMLSLSAFVICLADPAGIYSFRPTIALIILQLFLTYLWWSVGIYDKSHRKYNLPYTICFLFTTGLLFISLYLNEPNKRIILWLALVLNYLPPFLVIPVLKKERADFSLSSNMVERLGLFTIIVFGECVAGIINGATTVLSFSLIFWLNFALGILIVFSLWWIFFTLITDRESKGGFLNANLIEISYIPALASLGIAAAAISLLLNTSEADLQHTRMYFSAALCTFLFGISFLSAHLEYPKEFHSAKKTIRKLLFLVGTALLALAFAPNLSVTFYLCLVLVLLMSIIVTLTRIWFVIQLRLLQQEKE